MMVQRHEHYYGAGISDERFRTAAELASTLERQASWLKNLILKTEDGNVWFVYDTEHWHRCPQSCEQCRFEYTTEANPFGEGGGGESGFMFPTCESTDAVDYTDQSVQLVCDVFRRHNVGFTFKRA